MITTNAANAKEMGSISMAGYVKNVQSLLKGVRVVIVRRVVPNASQESTIPKTVNASAVKPYRIVHYAQPIIHATNVSTTTTPKMDSAINATTSSLNASNAIQNSNVLHVQLAILLMTAINVQVVGLSLNVWTVSTNSNVSNVLRPMVLIRAIPALNAINCYKDASYVVITRNAINAKLNTTNLKKITV